MTDTNNISNKSNAALAAEATAALEALHNQEVSLASPADYLSQGSAEGRTGAETGAAKTSSAITATRQDGAAQQVFQSSGHGSAAEANTSSSAVVATGGRPKVFLNVYNLVPPTRESAKGFSAEVLDIVGVGFHHSGVELLGQEYSFGSDESGRNDPLTEGVYSVYPRTACGHFKTQIELGEVPEAFSEAQFESILAALRPKWRSHTYHILTHNCNHFTAALVGALDGLHPSGHADDQKLMHKYPKWVNRAAASAAAVVPNALIRSITDAISPPTACAPDLVNFIDIPAYEGDYPPPLGPQTLPPSNRWVPPPAPQEAVTPSTVAAAAAGVVDAPNAARVNLAEGTQPQWDAAAVVTCSSTPSASSAQQHNSGKSEETTQEIATHERNSVCLAAPSVAGPEPTAVSQTAGENPNHQPSTQPSATSASAATTAAATFGARALGGLSLVGGFAKKMYKSVASTVRTSVVSRVDANDRVDYVNSFHGVDSDDLLSAYLCTVIHVNRPQKAKVFIAIDGIRIKGAHKLHLFVPYSEIHRYYYGAVIRPDERTDGNALPFFVPIDDPAKADCILLLLQIENRGPGLRMIPLVDFSFLGGNAFGAGNLIVKRRDVLRNAMAYLDFAIRASESD